MAGVEQIHKGDVGTVVTLLILQPGTDTPENISDATLMKAKIKLRTGTVVTETCSWVDDGKDGKMKFTSKADTFAVAGDATIQGYIETSGAAKKHHTTEYEFVVFDVLE